MALSNAIASSKSVGFAAALETVEGELAYPVAADRIAVNSSVTISQVRGTTDSEEKTESLDILYQFMDAKSPASWAAEFYTRTAGTANTESTVGIPQGDALLHALFGRVLSASGMTLTSAIDDVQTTIQYQNLEGEIPNEGYIKVEDELIYYGQVTRTSDSAGTFSQCTRGAGETVAASHVIDTAVGMWSRTYALSTETPSVSIWSKTNFLHQYLMGATPNTATFEVANSGGAKVSMGGEGSLMDLMGPHTVKTAVIAGATTYTANEAGQVAAGFLVQNKTKADDNNGAGYTIIDVDETTGAVTLSSGVIKDWAVDDLIEPFLVDFTPINVPLEGRHTSLRIGGVPMKVKNTSVTINVPKDYIGDIIEQDYPDERVNGTRSITMNITLYLRRSMVALFRQATEGKEEEFEITFGQGIGNQFVLTCPRGKYSAPTLSEDGNTVVMQLSVTMLGTKGEDSITARCE